MSLRRPGTLAAGWSQEHAGPRHRLSVRIDDSADGGSARLQPDLCCGRSAAGWRRVDHDGGGKMTRVTDAWGTGKTTLRQDLPAPQGGADDL